MNMHVIYAHFLVDYCRTLYPLGRDVFLLYSLGSQIVFQVHVSYRLFCTCRFLYIQGVSGWVTLNAAPYIIHSYTNPIPKATLPMLCIPT